MAPDPLELVESPGEVRRVFGRVVVGVGRVDLGFGPAPDAAHDLAGLGGVGEGLDPAVAAPDVVVVVEALALVDELEGELVVRPGLEGELPLQADLVALPVADRDEVQDLGAAAPPVGRGVRVREGPFGREVVGEIPDRARPADPEEHAIHVVVRVVGLPVVVRDELQLPFEGVPAFLRHVVDDARLRVPVLRIQAPHDLLDVLDGESGGADAAADERIAHGDAVDLELHLPRPAAAEVQFASARDDPGLQGDEVGHVVDRQRLRIFAADLVPDLRLLGLDDLAPGDDFDLGDGSEGTVLDLEVDGRRLASLDLHVLDGLVLIADEHDLDRVGPDGDVGDLEGAVGSAERPPLGAHEDDVRIGQRLPLQIGHAPRDGALILRRRERGEREEQDGQSEEDENPAAEIPAASRGSHGVAPFAGFKLPARRLRRPSIRLFHSALRVR